VFDPDFHEGVVGIVASPHQGQAAPPHSRFRRQRRAPRKAHELKGSGRSIPGFHLRDALDLVVQAPPRRAAATLAVTPWRRAARCAAEDQFEVFEQALAQVAREWLDAAALTRRIETDGPLASEYRRADLVDTLHREVWGQGFAPPTVQ
jgi:single-stranded-DNA-specific exonuclease